MEIKSHSYDDVYKASLEYFNGDELAARVWSSKYALKDSFGHIFELTPNDMHHRIASNGTLLASPVVHGVTGHFSSCVWYLRVSPDDTQGCQCP